MGASKDPAFRNQTRNKLFQGDDTLQSVINSEKDVTGPSGAKNLSLGQKFPDSAAQIKQVGACHRAVAA